VISTSGFHGRHFEFGRRQCHVYVGPGRKCGVEVEIASISQAVQKLLPRPLKRPPSWICGFRLHVTSSAVALWESSTPKMGGSRWNFVPMCHRTRYNRACLGSVATPSVLLKTKQTKLKSFPGHWAHRAALISVSIALSQTPTIAARPRIRG
jgi:hypothetical protein